MLILLFYNASTKTRYLLEFIQIIVSIKYNVYKYIYNYCKNISVNKHIVIVIVIFFLIFQLKLKLRRIGIGFVAKLKFL